VARQLQPKEAIKESQQISSYKSNLAESAKNITKGGVCPYILNSSNSIVGSNSISQKKLKGDKNDAKIN